MLHFESAGKGPAVVLLHAFPLSAQMWRAEIKSLSRRYQVIAPDLPGFGRSPRQSEPSIQTMAREVAAILDHLAVREPVFIGGLSMGGYVAFEFYRQFPGRVRSLGLFSTRAAADSPEAREKRFKAIESLKSLGLESYSRTVIPNLLGKTTQAEKPDVVSNVREWILANQKEGVMDALRAMASRADSTGLLAGIRCPALVAAGEEDTFIPLSEAEALHRQIPGAVFRAMAKAGHLINLEAPDIFISLLENFLAASSSAPIR